MFKDSTSAKDATLQRTDVNVLKQVCTWVSSDLYDQKLTLISLRSLSHNVSYDPDTTKATSFVNSIQLAAAS